MTSWRQLVLAGRRLLPEYIAMTYGVFTHLLRIVKAARVLRGSQETQMQNQSIRANWKRMHSGTLFMLLEGIAYLVAWDHADLRWFWLLFGVLLLSLTTIVFLVRIWRRLMPEFIAESDAMAAEAIGDRPPPSAAEQDSNTRFVLFQIALLIVWIYSWRHLFH